MRHGGRRLAALALAAGAGLALAPVARAVPAGVDLFETDPQATTFTFAPPFEIPAGFFAPGSAPFTGAVHFGGEPLGSFEGRDVGDADTVVRRSQGATLQAPFPAQATVPIELVALALVSVEPITVTVGSREEQWDVRVGLSAAQPSRGSLRLVQQGPSGGVFDSNLMVVPRFTFTRLGDGATRTIDLGPELQQPPRKPLTQPIAPELVLRAANAPWRAGCVAPALVAPRLSSGFCPGLTPDGRKVLTVEEARLAKHGIYPAQPPLEHFKCYGIQPAAPFRQRQVSLADQFGTAVARVVRPVELCTPVRKNRERYQNRVGHLKCYAVQRPTFRSREVAVRNQFGPDVLTVVRPSTLCLPSIKTRPTVRQPPTAAQRAALTDHYACYQVRPRIAFEARRAVLTDQFGVERVSVLRPVTLCAPVQKNRVAIRHPVRHLVCYEIRDPQTFRARTVRVVNQFGTEIVRVVRPRTLCVPSLKVLRQ